MVNNTNEALAGRLMKWPRAPTIEVFSFYFCELTEKKEKDFDASLHKGRNITIQLMMN